MKNMICSATSYVAVVPSDTVPINPFRRLYVGGTGTVTVRPAGADASATFTCTVAGTYLDIAGDQVMATGTTATGIVALYW